MSHFAALKPPGKNQGRSAGFPPWAPWAEFLIPLGAESTSSRACQVLPFCSTSGFSLSWFQCFKWQWNVLVITIKTMKFQRDLRSCSLHLTFLRCGTYDLEDWLSQRDYTASHCTAHLPHTCPGIFLLERTKWHLHPLLNYFKKTMEAKFVYNMPLNRNMMLQQKKTFWEHM